MKGNAIAVLHKSTAPTGGFRISVMTKGGGLYGHNDFPDIESARGYLAKHGAMAAAGEDVVNKAAVRGVSLAGKIGKSVLSPAGLAENVAAGIASNVSQINFRKAFMDEETPPSKRMTKPGRTKA
jgi:hypothetical protein